jgi:hypothetical protein
MKITLNLSSVPSPRERYALAWALPVALVALVGLFLLLSSSLASWRNYRKYNGVLSEVRSQEARLRDRQLSLERDLSRPEYKELFRNAQFINALIENRQFSVGDLTQKVAKLMPASVHLVGLALSHQEGEKVVRLTLAGDTEEAVETFLVSLEDAPDFEQVEILNQGVEQGEGGSTQVLLTCSAHFSGGKSAPEGM